jgi:hypothetical protein
VIHDYAQLVRHFVIKDGSNGAPRHTSQSGTDPGHRDLMYVVF